MTPSDHVRVTITAAIIWAVPILYSLLAEGYMIGQGHAGVPLTSVLRAIRFDLVGRFILVPFATWLYWHIILRPAGMGVGRQDLIPIVAGLLLAMVYGRWFPLGGAS